MKKLWSIATALIILCTCAFALGEEALVTVHCDEQGFSVQVPEGKSAQWVEDVGFQISVGQAGYVPYVTVLRRAGDMKFRNPVNYLNNVYREYMEEKYDNQVGTNPCDEYEIGGKTLLAASYHYTANGHPLCLTVAIEVREDGDVEYNVKYAEADPDAALALLEAVVASYQPDDARSDAGQAGGVLPLSVSGQEVDTETGTYWVHITDTDCITSGGYFTASLYLQDRYAIEEVEALKEGDTVTVAGQPFTVSSLVVHEDGTLEIYPREEFYGYIVFKKEADCYTALVNDWVPASPVADYKIMLPLPDDFTFVWVSGAEDAVVYNWESFIQLISDPETAPVLNQYNTTFGFNSGLPMMIVHADYPEGPVEE